MKSRIAAIVMSLACFGYLAISAQRVVELIRVGNWIGVGLAGSSAVVIVISAGLIFREIQFGRSMSQMASILESEKALTVDTLARTIDGRIEKSAADSQFESLKVQVEQEPESWRAWFRLAIAYDDARDRKRARAAMRSAEKLFRVESAH
ncbi:MAG: hypothetical protein RL410_736 [Actinomycetota bacterium]